MTPPEAFVDWILSLETSEERKRMTLQRIIDRAKMVSTRRRVVHHYWHYEGKTDLDKTRDEARLRCNKGISRNPESSIIHLHPYVENFDNCPTDPKAHELYEVER